MNGIWSLLWLLLAAVIGVVGSSLWTDYSFQILTIAVFLNAIATITLWQRAVRRPEKLKKKFLKRLFDTKPITPKHQPPPPLKEGYACGKKELQFFSDFADFADVVNWWLADEYKYSASAWRLQELPEVDLSLHGNFDHGPTYGRSYAIFHNQQRVGKLEIRSGFRYTSETPQVFTYIQLDFVRVFSFDTIQTFLTDIALHTCDYPGTAERFGVQQAIDRAITKVLWHINQASRFGVSFDDDYGEINLQLDGTATWYVERRDCEAFQKLKRGTPKAVTSEGRVQPP